MNNDWSALNSALNSLNTAQSAQQVFELSNQHKIQMDQAVLDTPEQVKNLHDILQTEHAERLKSEAKDKKIQLLQLVISVLTLLFSILFGLKVI